MGHAVWAERVGRGSVWSGALGQPVPLRLSPHARWSHPGARSPSAAPDWPASRVRSARTCDLVRAASSHPHGPHMTSVQHPERQSVQEPRTGIEPPAGRVTWVCPPLGPGISSPLGEADVSEQVPGRNQVGRAHSWPSGNGVLGRMTLRGLCRGRRGQGGQPWMVLGEET